MSLSAWLSDALRDARFGLRALAQRPGFALAAILPLALGLGAATAMYSVADGIMLRPVPFAEPDRLVTIWATEEQWKENKGAVIEWNRVVIGAGDYYSLVEQARSFSSIGAWARTAGMMADDDGTFAPANGIIVTSSIFDVLGVRPVAGREFQRGEDARNGPAIALLSWESWQARFGGDSSVIGRSIGLNEERITVVGIMPAGTRLDRTTPVPDFWRPAFQGEYDVPSQHNRNYRGIARLAPGVSVEQASEEAARIIRDYKVSWNGKADGTSGRATSYQADQTAAIRPSLIILGGATGMLLLIACVNLAILMLGESTRRQPEMAARTALGAEPARLIRQLLTESLVVSSMAAVIGLGSGWALLRVLLSFAPANIPGLADVRFDVRVFLFAVACATVAGIISGVLPVFALLRWGRHQVIGSASGLTPRGEVLVQRLLVGLEVSLSILMLVGCSLLGRSLLKLTQVDPGFVTDGIMQVQLRAPNSLWSDDKATDSYTATLLSELQGIAGVTQVTGTSVGFFGGGGSSSPIKVAGKPDPLIRRDAQQRVVLPEYFRTLQLPLIAGRDFASSDNASSVKVAIISQAEADRDFPGESPLGQRVVWQGEEWTVIGIAANAHFSGLDTDFQPTIYVPAAQRSGYWMNFLVRTAPGIDGALLVRAIRERIAAVNPAVTVRDLNPITTLMVRSYSEEQYRALLGSLFGIIGTVLAACGMFGVVARTVARRMREAGIRSALGASAPSLTRLMLRETVIGSIIGIGIGFPAAVLLARALTPYLYGVSSADPVAYLVALALFVIAAAVATIPSARRAAAVNPAIVMRSE